MVANDEQLYGKEFSWFAGTKVKAKTMCTTLI